MAYQQRDNSGSAFRNDRKREGKKDADFAGSGMIDGKEYWIDIWQHAPANGKKGFFSFSFREKESRGTPAARKQQPERRPVQKLAPPPTTDEPETDDFQPGDPNAPDADPTF